jgi:hypothetical protein
VIGGIIRDELPFLSVEISHYLFLILGGVFLALRFSNFVRREQFSYVFIANFNFVLGLHAIVIYFLGYTTLAYPEIMSANLAVGSLMLLDALLLKRKPYELANK